MVQTELQLFLVLINILILIFVAGIVVFVFQYRKRKILHEKEKQLIEEKNRVSLLDAKVDIQKQTMQFIGTEIHDSVAQKLVLAVMYSQRLEFENREPGINEKLISISNMIKDSLSELRELSKTLTDTKLQQSSFIELLQQQCEDINGTEICRADLHYDQNINIPTSSKSFLFRVVQEFVQNSLKHSNCSELSIDLQNTETGFQLTIKDNGIGFRVQDASKDGLGLANMKRRIGLTGGVHHLTSIEGEGTKLVITYPNQQT